VKKREREEEKENEVSEKDACRVAGSRGQTSIFVTEINQFVSHWVVLPALPFPPSFS
jgi:hypothetical protein